MRQLQPDHTVGGGTAARDDVVVDQVRRTHGTPPIAERHRVVTAERRDEVRDALLQVDEPTLVGTHPSHVVADAEAVGDAPDEATTWRRRLQHEDPVVVAEARLGGGGAGERGVEGNEADTVLGAVAVAVVPRRELLLEDVGQSHRPTLPSEDPAVPEGRPEVLVADVLLGPLGVLDRLRVPDSVLEPEAVARRGLHHVDAIVCGHD